MYDFCIGRYKLINIIIAVSSYTFLAVGELYIDFFGHTYTDRQVEVTISNVNVLYLHTIYVCSHSERCLCFLLYKLYYYIGRCIKSAHYVNADRVEILCNNK